MNNKLFLEIINCSIVAGQEIMKIYETGNLNVEIKSDNSPVTIADKKSNELIMKTLKNTEYPIISEENKSIDYEIRKNWKKYWLVDPLDGTKDFINRGGDFTVNIALVENKTPIAGVIYVPVSKTLYFGSNEIGSYKKISVNNTFSDFSEIVETSQKLPIARQHDTYRVIASKSHFNAQTEEVINKLRAEHSNLELINVGSSLKLCSIAEGTADLYPRFGPTMEWDIAAGHAIVKAMGGKVLIANSDKELEYNKENLLNPFFVVSR